MNLDVQSNIVDIGMHNCYSYVWLNNFKAFKNELRSIVDFNSLLSANVETYRAFSMSPVHCTQSSMYYIVFTEHINCIILLIHWTNTHGLLLVTILTKTVDALWLCDVCNIISYWAPINPISGTILPTVIWIIICHNVWPLCYITLTAIGS